MVVPLVLNILAPLKSHYFIVYSVHITVCITNLLLVIHTHNIKYGTTMVAYRFFF